jgi:pre-mRNA-processing factor 6
MRAADLEHNEAAKKAVLRKALESNPTSVTLWKAAIDLEEAEDAKILLSVAVERVPQSVEMWLALARLESYDNARKVLNQARRALPAERSIWITAARLEESQGHDDVIDKIIEKAVKALAKRDAVVTRAQWLLEAESAEKAGAPLTSAAIVKYTLGQGVDPEDRQRTWADDAKGALSRNCVATARAILAHSLAAFPNKRSLWLQAVDLEQKHGTPATLDEVLAAASERLPRVEIFWLLRAKERWQANDVDKAREILTNAFLSNPDSEAVWLAAAKLEWETGEIERARVLLERARERAPTDRVFMKSASLEREQKTFPKLYMMGGQICSEELPRNKSNLDRARKVYQRGLQECSTNVVLWILASRLEERAHLYDAKNNGHSAKPDAGVTKARSLLELARLKNPKNPDLWLESTRLERRTGNGKLADSLLARALQECPSSGPLLAENILTAPRVEQKSKSADAIKKNPDDPYVIAAVASLFASERKHDKARKWFDRAVILNPDLGDSWVRYYAFEMEAGTPDLVEKVVEKWAASDPKHGELWASVRKAMENRGKTVAELLQIAATKLLQSAHIS